MTDMKNFKRIFSILLCAALLCGMLAGCSAPVDTPADTPADSSSEVSSTVESEPVEDSSSESLPEEDVTLFEGMNVRLGGMKGPTTMGMVKLLEDAEAGSTINEYDFTIAAAADELTPLLIQGNMDIAAVPVNLASVLYNKTEGQIQMLAVNTLGVLYVVEKGGETINSVEDLAGKTIFATGKGTTPEYSLTYLLAQHGLTIGEDVTVEWKSEATEVVSAMATMDSAVAMLPQPFVTVASTQLEGLRVALDLTAEWNALDNGSSLVTGCLVVRRDFAEANPEAVAAFLTEYAASTEYANTNPAETSVMVEKYGIVKAPIAEKALPKCNIVCLTGTDMTAAAEGYLQVLFDQNPAAVGGALPGEDFWYVQSK